LNKLLVAATRFILITLFFQTLTHASVQAKSPAESKAIKAIDKLLLNKAKGCPSSSKSFDSENETLSLIGNALYKRFCQANPAEIVVSTDQPKWIQYFFHHLNSQIAKKNNQKARRVRHSLLVVDSFRTQKDKENYLLSLRKEFSKDLYPKLFKQIQNKIYKVSPRYLPPELKNYIEIGRDYKKSGDFRKALKFLRRGWQKLKLSTEENHKVSLEITNTVKAVGGYSQFIPQTEKYIKFFKRQNKKGKYDDAIFDHSVLLIRANWTKGRVTRAKRLATDLIKKYPNNQKAYQLWLLSSIEKDLKHKKSSRAYLVRALKALKNSKSKYFEKILFDAATISYQNRDIKLYDHIVAQDLSNIRFERDRQRLFYWQARLYEEKKKFKQSNDLYKKLININPIAYYALLASSRTGILPEIQVTEVSTNQIPDHLWFLQLKSNLLRKWYLSNINYNDESLKEGLLIAKLMQEDGLFHESFKFLYEFPQEDLIRALKTYPKLFYPYAFKNYLNKAPVDPLLALAIIKRESLYNPNAQSVANALGLMQVLPAVGKQMNRKIKRNKELFNPKTNIQVGTKYIARVLKRFDQNLVQSVAAYNAGPRRVKIWKKKKIFSGDLDESIESIPYMETRKYVKKVIRNYLNYKRLYDKDFSIDDLKVLVKEKNS
jgi:tetratricopeptide (TPR) repeat protein